MNDAFSFLNTILTYSVNKYATKYKNKSKDIPATGLMLR